MIPLVIAILDPKQYKQSRALAFDTQISRQFDLFVITFHCFAIEISIILLLLLQIAACPSFERRKFSLSVTTSRMQIECTKSSSCKYGDARMYD